MRTVCVSAHQSRCVPYSEINAASTTCADGLGPAPSLARHRRPQYSRIARASPTRCAGDACGRRAARRPRALWTPCAAPLAASELFDDDLPGGAHELVLGDPRGPRGVVPEHPPACDLPHVRLLVVEIGQHFRLSIIVAVKREKRSSTSGAYELNVQDVTLTITSSG